MISLIGISIICLAHLVYDYFGMGGSTNWSIYYFTSIYLGIITVAFDVICKEQSKTVRYIALSMGLYFLTYLIWELTFINVPFDQYMKRVNNYNMLIISSTIFGITVLVISLKALAQWVKRHSRK